MTENEKLSYALGLSIGANLEDQGFTEIDGAKLAAGLNDHLNHTDKQLDPSEVNQILGDAMKKANEAKMGDAAKAGQEFLAENAKRDEVTVLESGLQYRVMTEGTGSKPAATDQVTTHYHGKLINGSVFDSSVERGKPATFPVNGVIQGWVEALQLMPVGSKWELFIPYHLAYGERGAGGSIPPYSALIFEVELLAIV